MSINLVISEICCNFKVLIYKQLQTKIAMITKDKVTEIFCMADDFCKFFDAMVAKYTLKPTGKRKYHRDSTMSKAEVMLIMILFHDSGYRCFKHFYLEKVCKHLRNLFPKVVSYNRIVELEREVVIPLALFIKKVLLGKCTGISFVDSTPLRVCKNQRIHIHKVFKGIAQRGKCSMGWFFGFKLHLICNEKGELLNFMITPGDIDDRKPLEEILADVPLVADQPAIYKIHKSFVFQRLTVINISRCYHKIEKFSFLITNQMQFETEEPTHRAFSSLSYAFENLMNMYSLVFADTQWCAVNETYTRAFA